MLLYMALIFVISSFAVKPPLVEHVPFHDKGIHFLEYGMLGWLCASASHETWPAGPAWRVVTFAVFITFLWGLSDEIHQAMVPGRSPELADAAADLLGAIAGAGGWQAFRIFV